MGLFDKALKDAIGKGLQNAVGKAVESAARPVAQKVANQAAQKVSSAAEKKMNEVSSSFAEANAAMAEANEAAKGVTDEQWSQAFSFLEGMANDAMKDVRVCPQCQEPVKGDVKFCPKCGAKLPEMTVLEMALCPNCGKQNAAGTDFCVSCGTKLPGRVMAEEARQAKDRNVLAQWAQQLGQFPVWNCGGSDYEIETIEAGRVVFSAFFSGDSAGARQAVAQYKTLLKGSGFRTAGQYPSDEHLYKMVDGVCCHVDTEHCFESDADSPSIYFAIGDEPTGGFDYVKPEPKKKSGGLFGGLFG